MNKKLNQNEYKTVTFSKDNPIIEISTKQSQVQKIRRWIKVNILKR